jgi:lipid-A-disaccharide synthase
MGGEQMAAAGVRIIQDSSEVAVVGIFEVLAHLPAIRRAKNRLEERLRREKPDLFVPIDFPDFNLRLAAGAHAAGVAVVYFVSPQIWAWRKGRIRQIREIVRRMLVLFPFETTLYEEAGVPVTFVGHPVADRPREVPPRETLCRQAGLDPGGRIVALLPGSRRGEVRRLLPVLLETARIMSARRAGLQWLIPQAPGLAPEALDAARKERSCGEIRVHAGDFPGILGICDAGAVAAGTASLEAAVVGMPMVVVHRIHPVSYMLARSLVGVERVALPNLIAGRDLVPELLQRDCTPPRIAEELGRYLDDPERARSAREGLAEVRGRLGGAGVFERVATQVLADLDEVRRNG